MATLPGRSSSGVLRYIKKFRFHVGQPCAPKMCRSTASSSGTYLEALHPSFFTQPPADSEQMRANVLIEQKTEGTAQMWERDLNELREARRADFTYSSRAYNKELPSLSNGPVVNSRIFTPSSSSPRAAVLHIHGGGFVMGSAAGQNDARLQTLADTKQFVILSVDYRLSPEYPFPAPRDDCLSAAHWLAQHGPDELGCPKKFFVYGESAGANLAVSMLCRFRDDNYGWMPFSATSLAYGFFDCGLSPSARNWGERRLVENTKELAYFADCYCQGSADCRDPEISPLYADLKGLPPALFTVGTEDALLDDSLFMYSRWVAARNVASLALYRGAPHGVGHFGEAANTAQGKQVRTCIEDFLDRYV